MPLLSVIVPVHNVEPYLRQCLDSILDQGVDDLEVVAVDDASTDRSGDILREYEQRDTRVRLVSLEHNVGLGHARNAGLDVARGPYVLFVDSDDWLAPDSLPAIVTVLESAEPDLVVYDFARSFGDSEPQPDPRGDILRRAPRHAFSLDEHPDLAGLLMVVWNKVYRRGLIDEIGVRFHEGFYEDLPWTNPVLMAARRIVALPRVCYVYRARSGSIVRTPTSRHFEAFTQYDRVFAFLDEHAELAHFRPLMHARMVRHLLAILRRGDERVPPGQQAEFFHEIVRMYRKFRPPTELVRRREALVLRTNAFPAFQLLLLAEKLWRRLRARRGSPLSQDNRH